MNVFALQVRMTAISYLQRALLMHDLQTLSASEWESCFNNVLFPLLEKLSEPFQGKDHTSEEETRMRAANLLSKVGIRVILFKMGLTIDQT